MASVSNNEESGGRGILERSSYSSRWLKGVEFVCCPSQCGDRPRLGYVGGRQTGGVIGTTEHAATIRRPRSRCSGSSRRSRARTERWGSAIDGRLTASCRKPLADQAVQVGGPLGRQLSRPNRVRQEYDKSGFCKCQMSRCTARTDRCVAASWESRKPGGSRLKIDKYVCSWTWLSLVGS